MSISQLWTTLILLILASSFFSLAETAYMSVNRYRLRHMAKKGSQLAKRAQTLLERPDRLLGVILLGDTFANILASAIATIIALHYFNESQVFIATIILTFTVLIFGQLAPKTLAALHASPIVLYSAWPLWILLKITQPMIIVINILSNSLLKLFGIKSLSKNIDHFTTEELRTVVAESSHHLPHNYQQMLLQLLDLEKIYVEDIMIARNEIIGIDLNKPLDDIIEQLTTSQHMRLPVYHEDMNNITGILSVRAGLNVLANVLLTKDKENFTRKRLKSVIEKPYFIPEGTSLNRQLLEFKQKKTRMSLVVDEYGDILGLVALEDILEEIVGEFTTNIASDAHKDILLQNDHTYLVDGSVNLRVLNRTLGLSFSVTGPKTLSGLIIEYLEIIPPANICIRLSGYPLEILQVKDNKIKTVRLFINK